MFFCSCSSTSCCFASHVRCILQDLVKRLLQKDPNARLPFSAFFSHPFLSGQPLHNIQALPEPPEIYVEEPSSSAIDGDYVILSIPPASSAQQARGSNANDEPVNRATHSAFLHPCARVNATCVQQGSLLQGWRIVNTWLSCVQVDLQYKHSLKHMQLPCRRKLILCLQPTRHNFPAHSHSLSGSMSLPCA